MQRGESMQIRSLYIKNFKSIHELFIEDVESALILVGKNNTGKTVVLDAIRIVCGNYIAKESDFNHKKQNIEIEMVLEVTEDDLHQFHKNGIVSTFKRYDSWKRDFCEKLPSYVNERLVFVCVINHDGKVRYDDGTHKNNRYIQEVLPKLHFIDTARELASFQEDLLMFQKTQDLMKLRSNTCMFDSARNCNHCFSCIGLINQKKPQDLQLYETVRLMEYKMYQLNLSEFSQKINANYHKNGGVEEIQYTLSCDMDKMFEIAEVLSRGLPFARIDLYNSDGKIYFGEITFFPDSGFDPNILPETNEKFGRLINITNCEDNA